MRNALGQRGLRALLQLHNEVLRYETPAPMPSLQRKIKLGYYAFAGAVAGVALLAYSDLTYLEHNIAPDVAASRLLDAVLEIRRYEKNWFLYGGAGTLAEVESYAGQAQELIAAARPQLLELGGASDLDRLDADLAAYRRLLAEVQGRTSVPGGTTPGMEEVERRLEQPPRSREGRDVQGTPSGPDGTTPGAEEVERRSDQPPSNRGGQEDQAQAPPNGPKAIAIRQAGRRLADGAEGIAHARHARLQEAIAKSRATLLAAGALAIVLSILAAQWLAGRTTRPLGLLVEQLRDIAAGRYDQVAPVSEDREILAVSTAANRMLAELEARRRHLVQAEKLASLGTLVSGVAHELNNPLSNVSTSCQILIEELATADQTQMQGVALSDRHRDRARPQHRADPAGLQPRRGLSQVRLALRPLIERTLLLVGPAAKRAANGADLEVNVPEGLTVDADPQRLQQVLVNLIGNALDAGGPGVLGKHLRAGLRRRDLQDARAQRLRTLRGARLQRGASGPDRGGGPGSRHRPGGPPAGLRPLLHHQGRRPRVGTRALCQPGDRPPARRLHRGEQPARRGDPVPHRPALQRHPGDAMNKQQGQILVIDDEAIALKNLLHILRKEGYAVTGAQSGQAGLKALSDRSFDLVITDLRMERVDGLAILRHCREHLPDARVIVLTGHATVSSAVDAMKEGAFHYIAKPFRLDEVRHVVREALELAHLKRENRALRAQVEAQVGIGRPITQDPIMTKLLETARQIAPTDCNVIITGASGTGKELVARYIHAHSGRGVGPFVAVNCGALSEELLANELFGHDKGAYTGAAEGRAGLIEAAVGGTLFLDEITEMSLGMQVKLLRVIQEREVLRLGSTRPVKVDVRYLAATNRDLPEAVASGRFRQDLYYRLNVMHLEPTAAGRAARRRASAGLPLPPPGCRGDGARRPDIAPEAMALLTGYGFPGNVRELANLVERGVALATGNTLGPEELPDDLRELRVQTYRRDPDVLPSLEAQEADYIQWVLTQTGGNRTRAAEILGIDRVSLWRRLKRYGLDG